MTAFPDLPPPLTLARRFALVRYADFQDVRAGRAPAAAARVLRRARRWRLAVVVLTGVLVALAVVDVVLLRSWFSLVDCVWWTVGLTAAFGTLGRMIRGLEQLADADDEAAPARGA